MPLQFKDIKVGGTYKLVQCSDTAIECYSKSREVTVSDISSRKVIWSTDVAYGGVAPEDSQGWAIASDHSLSSGKTVLEAVKE